MTTVRADSVRDWFWTRHANPKSGWSRVPTGAVIVYAVYQRDWRLLTTALLWTLVNPVLFAPPETEDAWVTDSVRHPDVPLTAANTNSSPSYL